MKGEKIINKQEINNKRITKIKDEHIKLLNMVKSQIQNQNTNFIQNSDELLKVLELDKENIKRYEAVKKAQDLIVSLTEQIINANSKEEVLKIRNKINYYIKKIQLELKARGLENSTISNYNEHFTSLRKDMAKYIRFIKREDNILKMENLNSRFDTLSNEEDNVLHELLRNEVNYNTRNLNPNYENKSKKTTIIKAHPPYFISPKEILMEEVKESENITLDVDDDFEYYVPETTGDSLQDSINFHNTQYDIVETHDYSGSLPKRIFTLMRNIPKYIHNNNRIKVMKAHTKFYEGSDFISYIEYLKKRNSLKYAINCVFKKTYLSSNETIYLNNHNECREWLIEYCKRHSLENPTLVKKII